MATVPVKEDAFLASQCLDFCQMLAGKSLSFSFSLKIGTNFSFSLDTRGGSFVFRKEETNSINLETQCQEKRTVFAEKTCFTCTSFEPSF